MKDSKIEWTDHTHNEWIGCNKISDGCKNCYAENLMDKRLGQAQWGTNRNRVLTSIQNRSKPFIWNRKAHEDGIRYKVFAQSLSDSFEDREELEAWRLNLFATILNTQNLDWLILTKRPEVAKSFFDNHPEFSNLPNVWLGVSIEDQQSANKRIPVLLDIPAKTRFLSCEPLLGSINFNLVKQVEPYNIADETIDIECINPLKGKKQLWNSEPLFKIPYDVIDIPKIDWVIVGGESGSNARPVHPDWIRSVRDQCKEADVPFFFKQWGEWKEVDFFTYDGVSYNKIRKLFGFPLSSVITIGKVGKKKAGAMLDGREWKEFPNEI